MCTILKGILPLDPNQSVFSASSLRFGHRRTHTMSVPDVSQRNFLVNFNNTLMYKIYGKEDPRSPGRLGPTRITVPLTIYESRFGMNLKSQAAPRSRLTA